METQVKTHKRTRGQLTVLSMVLQKPSFSANLQTLKNEIKVVSSKKQ